MKERWPEKLEYEKRVQEMTREMGMTDLERDRIVGGIIDAYTLAPNDEDEKREAVARQIDAALAAARREGAAEMRERATEAVKGWWPYQGLADAIHFLPLTPEEPT